MWQRERIERKEDFNATVAREKERERGATVSPSLNFAPFQTSNLTPVLYIIMVGLTRKEDMRANSALLNTETWLQNPKEREREEPL